MTHFFTLLIKKEMRGEKDVGEKMKIHQDIRNLM